MDNGIHLAQNFLHGCFIADIASDEIERGIGAEMKESLAGTIHEVIESSDLVSGRKQVLARDTAEVAEATRHKNVLGHDLSPESVP
jgi:hypothetical protein